MGLLLLLSLYFFSSAMTALRKLYILLEAESPAYSHGAGGVVPDGEINLGD